MLYVYDCFIFFKRFKLVILHGLPVLVDNPLFIPMLLSLGRYAIYLYYIGMLSNKLSVPWFYFLEQGIISRFGSFRVEIFWYYCCTHTGNLCFFLFLF